MKTSQPFPSLQKLLWMVVLLAFAAGSACAYAPQQIDAKPGDCRFGREWVKPSQDENGNWRDGYCKDPETGS